MIKDEKIQLPRDYTNFIVGYFDQPLGRKFFKTKDGKVESLIKSFIPWPEVEDYLSHGLGTEVPHELLPIALTPAGNKVCIGIKEKVAGKIFYWSEDEEDEGHELSYDYIRLVADSFSEFLNGLTASR